MMNKSVQLLDATLRDGGQGFEDACTNMGADISFTPSVVNSFISLFADSGIDIIELGSIRPSNIDDSRFAIYNNIEDLSSHKPKTQNVNQMFVGLYIGPDTPVRDIPEWNPNLIDGVRVILRYSELKKSIDFCFSLASKGYKVFVQPMLTMRYSDNELDYIISSANQMNAYALYFVDSYGYMKNEDIYRLFHYYDSCLNKQIRIGFHPHNNMSLAYSNAICFLNIVTDRSLIIDSCVTGMGQGAGNLQTELIIPYLNENYGKKFNYEMVLDICDIIENTYEVRNLWGYSVARLLPALYKTAYKYALVMRYKYNMSYRDILFCLQNIPPELKNRYTSDNLDNVLSRYNSKLSLYNK